jgi:hypothetical protein
MPNFHCRATHLTDVDHYTFKAWLAPLRRFGFKGEEVPVSDNGATAFDLWLPYTTGPACRIGRYNCVLAVDGLHSADPFLPALSVPGRFDLMADACEAIRARLEGAALAAC